MAKTKDDTCISVSSGCLYSKEHLESMPSLIASASSIDMHFFLGLCIVSLPVGSCFAVGWDTIRQQQSRKLDCVFIVMAISKARKAKHKLVTQI